MSLFSSIANVVSFGGSGAAEKAARQQAAGQRNAIAEQRREFDIAQKNLQPYYQTGTQALGQLQDLVKNGGIMNDFTGADLQNDPGYQFRLNQGLQGVQNSAAARGGLLSGGTLKALTQYGQNFASNEFQNAFNRNQAQNQSHYNYLAGLANTGQVTANTLSNLNQNEATNVGNLMQNIGTTNAMGTLGANAALQSGLNKWLQLGSMVAGM